MWHIFQNDKLFGVTFCCKNWTLCLWRFVKTKLIFDITSDSLSFRQTFNYFRGNRFDQSQLFVIASIGRQNREWFNQTCQIRNHYLYSSCSCKQLAHFSLLPIRLDLKCSNFSRRVSIQFQSAFDFRTTTFPFRLYFHVISRANFLLNSFLLHKLVWDFFLVSRITFF